MRFMHRRYQLVPQLWLPTQKAPGIPRAFACGWRLLRLADLEPDEPGHGDTGLVEQRLHGLLVVGHRRLIEQHDVLKETGHAALDDLGQRLLGLALVSSGLLGDAALVGDDILRHILARE